VLYRKTGIDEVGKASDTQGKKKAVNIFCDSLFPDEAGFIPS
jgi:hypothetical protein